MLIKAEMVPLPVTAGEKIREAVYFFSRMIETRTNVNLFPFHFSAFLSALRSTTLYLQTQFSKDAAFESWYARKQEELRNDPLMRMLKEMRDEALHARPIQLKFWHGPTLPEEGIETNHLAVSMETDERGEVRIRTQVGADGEEAEVPPVVHWVVDLPEEIDILSACDSGLRKIQAILIEWEQRRNTIV